MCVSHCVSSVIFTKIVCVKTRISRCGTVHRKRALGSVENDVPLQLLLEAVWPCDPRRLREYLCFGCGGYRAAAGWNGPSEGRRQEAEQERKTKAEGAVGACWMGGLGGKGGAFRVVQQRDIDQEPLSHLSAALSLPPPPTPALFPALLTSHYRGKLFFFFPSTDVFQDKTCVSVSLHTYHFAAAGPELAELAGLLIS